MWKLSIVLRLTDGSASEKLQALFPFSLIESKGGLVPLQVAHCLVSGSLNFCLIEHQQQFSPA